MRRGLSATSLPPRSIFTTSLPEMGLPEMGLPEMGSGALSDGSVMAGSGRPPRRSRKAPPPCPDRGA
ncbi:MAG: hypothetical protein IIA36_10790 [Proteobacteria bacterium]|nr:hypothetical protein [Pseudomonadota bacterium]